MSAASRTASLRRATSESTVELDLDLDGTGRSRIDTTVPFFDHLLTAFAKHSLTDLTVRASGDTDIDAHHTVEALGYTAHDSWTNFILFGGVDDPATTWQGLYDRGVLIRDVGIPHHLRVTAGTEDETTAFLDALASVGSAA